MFYFLPHTSFLHNKIMKKGTIIEHKDRYDLNANHKYPHDKEYTFEGEVRCKDRVTGEWYDAMLYKEIGGNLVCCRDKQAFLDEFNEKGGQE